MKKAAAFLLALLMLLVLCACGESGSGSSGRSSGKKKESVTKTNKNKINFSEPLELDEAELRFRACMTGPEVRPPIRETFYTVHEAGEGKTFLILCAELVNLDKQEHRVEELAELELSVSGEKERLKPERIYAVTDGGTEIERDPVLEPQQSRLLLFAFEIPEEQENARFDLRVTDRKGNLRSGSFSEEELTELCPELVPGEPVEGPHLVLTLEKVFFTEKLIPSNPKGYYSTFSAPEGKSLLVVRISFKNLMGTGICFDKLADVHCLYAGKYHYDSSCVFEKADGSDLNSFPGNYSLDPLDTRSCCYLIAVPPELQQGPAVITVFCDGVYYRCSLPRDMTGAETGEPDRS